jgi:uncharacterized protein involved in exopolysaccharide biosynthesis
VETVVENLGMREPANYEIRQLTLRDMLGPLFRNWRIVLVTYCVISVLAIVAAWGWANHYYVATMQVIVARERSEPTVSGQQENVVVGNEPAITADEVASEIALLQGRDMLQEVGRVCGLAKHDTSDLDSLNKSDSHDLEVKNTQALERATKALSANLRVEAQKMSRVIDVQYGQMGAPETPACVLQTLGKLYLEKHLRLQRPAGTFDFFSEETKKYEQALADSEIRLANFSRSEGVAAPDILRANMAQQLVAAQASLYQARQMIAADQQRIENLKKQMVETPPRSSTAEASNSANILLQQLQSSMLASQIKRIQLLAKYDPSYPPVKEADAEIAETEEAIHKAEESQYRNTTTDRDPTFEYLREDRARTEADLAAQQAAAAELLNTIHGMRSELVSLDEKAVKQAALVRETKTNEGNYLLYLTKREQERTSDALDDKRIANVAIAVPAAIPVLPAHNPNSIMLAGFFFAVLGGIGAGYFAELIDPSFRTPAEVEEMLKITVLAAVPKEAA